MSVLDKDGLTYFQQKKYNPAKWNPRMTLQVGRDEHGGLWAVGEGGSDYPKYGVSGVGGSSATLTRLWDAVGKTATAGTDQTAGASDFDNLAPFNRKKCVGNWTLVNGVAVFNVQAYQGDADYAEDGSKGDYVAVEVPPVYWYHDEEEGILGVSAGPHAGWEPHPVCVDGDGHVRAKTYLPVYALAQKDGHAVSLPGYHNFFGTYKQNWDAARTYGDGSTFLNVAIIEPSAVDHYEWLMMTIEFATTNMQTVMYGAGSMRWVDDIVSATPAANKVVVTAACGDGLVVGQTVLFCSTRDYTPANVSAYNCVTAIEACDADGTLNASGTYRLVTYDGDDRTASITVGTTLIATRPWITGATQGYASGVAAVLGHTGSPVSNSNGKYPMMYRWRENVYGNQFMTCLDLMDVRVEVGTDEYKVQWYHNPDLQHEGASKYYPAGDGYPNLANLQDESTGWELLGVETPKESYVSGWIKEEGFDEKYPHVRVPTLTSGGSATTYYADYAHLVNSSVVRAVRRRGNVVPGLNAGPRYVLATNAPAARYWSYGSGLYFAQRG